VTLAERFAVSELAVGQGSFAADVALTKAAGVSAIGADARAVDEVGVDEARRILEREGVRASSYLIRERILQHDGGTASLDETARRLDAAATLGAPGALVLTGGLDGRSAADADAACRDWLSHASEIAADRGIRIMLEPIHPILRGLSYVHTLAHALTLVAGLPGAGVVLDFAHVWWEHGLDALIREHVADIVSVQITNVDSEALRDRRYVRAGLDSGEIEVAALVRLLESSGYRGWYEDEILVETPRDQRLDRIRASREWFQRETAVSE
jgi:sugar phosphate isomerase/epimerase